MRRSGVRVPSSPIGGVPGFFRDLVRPVRRFGSERPDSGNGDDVADSLNAKRIQSVPGPGLGQTMFLIMLRQMSEMS